MNYITLEYDYITIMYLHYKKLLEKDQLFTIKSKQFPEQGLILRVYDYSCKDGLPILEIDDKINIGEITNIESVINGKKFHFYEIIKINDTIYDKSKRYKSYQEKLKVITDYLFEIHKITKDVIEDNDTNQLIRDIKINIINDIQ